MSLSTWFNFLTFPADNTQQNTKENDKMGENDISKLISDPRTFTGSTSDTISESTPF